MTGDPVTAYLQAVQKLELAQVNLRIILTRIEMVAYAIRRHWAAEAAASRIIEPESFPTGEVISQRLCEVRAALCEVKEAWDAIPGPRRRGMKSPSFMSAPGAPLDSI